MNFELVPTEGPFDTIDKLVWREIYFGTDEDYRPSLLAAWRSGFDVYRVTTDTGELLATGCLGNRDGEPDEFELEHIAVAPEARGQGLGRLVVESLISVAKEKGASRISLHATESSVDFYKRLGMQETPNASPYQHHMTLDLSDAK